MSPLSRTGLLAGRTVRVVRRQRPISPPDLELFCKALERRTRPCRSDSLTSRRASQTPSPQSALSDLLRHCTESPDTSLAKGGATPPTPPPTLISRRCLTPDRPRRGRATLVLDLRRSRSHDKLDSTATSLAQSANETPVKTIPIATKTGLSSKPIMVAAVPGPGSGLGPGPGPGQQGITPAGPPTINIESVDEAGVMKRRGKKLKRRKGGRGAKGDADVGFQGLSEPEKTQVSALEGAAAAAAADPNAASAAHDNEDGSDERSRTSPLSFLDDASLHYLHRGLTADAIQCEIRSKRKAALVETARVLGLPGEDDDLGPIMVVEKHDKPLEQEELDETADPLGELPRVSTWADSVFLLPMNTQLLHTLSPLGYLRDHITLSHTSVALYRRIFCKLSQNHVLPEKQMQKALSELVGRPLSPEAMKSLHDQLDWSSTSNREMDFPTWCGVAAAAERLACIPQVCGPASPSSEIERADMAAMERYLATLPPEQPAPPLASLLRALTTKPENR